MSLRDYEITFVLSTTLDEEGQTAAVERVNHLIANGGGSVTEVHAWGRRHLAYPIEHQRDGFYVTTRFKLPPLAQMAFENDLRLNENILRHIVVRQDEAPLRPPLPVAALAGHAAEVAVIAEPAPDIIDEDDDLADDLDPDVIPAAED